jgi:hypothetical protein
LWAQAEICSAVFHSDNRTERQLNARCRPKFLEDFNLLMKLGVIGPFDHFEMVRYQDGNATPANVVTIAVALENGTGQKTEKLNQARIGLGAAKEHSFGVFKSTVSADALGDALQNYFTTRSWSPNGVPISVSSLQPTAKQFVPPTGSTDAPLNRVLKNNFSPVPTCSNYSMRESNCCRAQ